MTATVMSSLGIFLAASLPAPPVSERHDVTETIHGVTITDPYRWLEDQNSAATRAWIGAEMGYTKSVLGTVPGRDKIHEQLSGLMQVEEVGAPLERGGRIFFTKRLATQDQAVLYMRAGIPPKDTVLADPNPLSPDHSTSVTLLGVSHDGELLAYGLRAGGKDETTLTLMDTSSMHLLPERFPAARYSSVAIQPDKSGFYYSKFTAKGYRVYHHAIGAAPEGDPEIFGKGTRPEDFVGCELSVDGRYLTFVVGHGWNSSDVYFQNLQAKGPVVTVVKGIEANFEPVVIGERMYLKTNWKAPNGRLMVADLKNPAMERWWEVIPERKVALDSFEVAGGKLALNYLENVSSKEEIHSFDGKLERTIALPGLGTATGPYGRPDSEEAFYTFTSFAEPMTVYRYQVATGKQEVWFRNETPFDPATVEVKQVWYSSKDGTRIPMFVAYRKGLEMDGNRPVLLTGYGGFNVSETPNYSARAAFWIERGGVYASANLRGGAEFGEAWHRAGMLDKKQNVFDDFIGAAEYLIANKYTAPARLAIIGGSNGGLLMGTAFTQRPDLFGAVVCAVPLLDMVRYHMFKVAKWWTPEYGSSEDEKQFQYIYKYSPYHHVKAGEKYPAILFVTGDSDTRVDPLHARKMTALMQASTGSRKPVLLHYDTEAGHSAGLPVTKRIDDETDMMSFLMWQLGMLK